MGRMRTWLVMFLSAVFLCCAAAFAVGCSRMPSVTGESPTYTAQPDSVGATREEGQLRVELNEELLAQQPLFTTSALDDLKDYLTVTINEDGGDRVLGAEEYSLSGSMATAGEQTFTVTYLANNNITATVQVNITAVVVSSLEGVTAAVAYPTLWSTADLSAIDSRYFTGSVEYNDGSTNAISSFDFTVELVADPDEADGEIPDSLMPENTTEGTADTYSRFVRIVITNSDGSRVESDPIELTVHRDTISQIWATLTNYTPEANTSITEESYGLTVTAYYTSAPGTTRTIALDDPHLTITYIDEDGTEAKRDLLAFGDTGVKFVYTEPYTGETKDYTLSGFVVREAVINAPSMDVSGNIVYDGIEHGKSFSNYNETTMTYSDSENITGVAADGSTIEFTFTNAGEYSVTFTVDEGFAFRTPLPSGAVATTGTGEAGQEIVTAVTYTWTVTRASLTAANVSFTVGSNWTYAADNSAQHAKGAQVTVGESTIDLSDAKIAYYYVGRNDTTYEASTAAPTQAGDYAAYVVISGLANYADVTSNQINFTIKKANNTITFNGGSAWTWVYGGAMPGDEDAVLAALTSAFDTDLASGDSNYREDIQIVFYTKSEVSTTYPTTSTGWNVGEYILEVTYPGNDNINEATERFTITVTKGTIYFDGTLSMNGWTFGDTADIPEGVTVSVGSADTKTALSGVGGYYFSMAENGTYSDWDTFLAANDSTYNGDAALNAGTYYVRYQVTGTGNYDAASGTAASFTVTRREVAKPTFDDSATTHTSTYDENAQTATVVGFDDAIMSGSASSGSGFNDSDALTATNANTYTLTVSIADSNYTWTGEGTAPTATPSDVTLTWTIDKAQNEITAADTFAGWTYGNMPTSTDALNAQLAFTADEQEIVYTFYNSDNEAVTIGNTTPAGEYTLVLSVDGSKNTIGCQTDAYSFTVAKGRATISASLADTEDWEYKDALSDHELTANGTVAGSAGFEFGSENYTVTYQRSNGTGWETVSNFNENAPAGDYRVVISLTDDSNYTADDVTISFTIQKFVVAIPDFGRIHELSGEVWTPDIPADGGTDVHGAEWSVSLDNDSSTDYGVYWLTLTLDDPNNYAWGENYESYNTADGLVSDYIDESNAAVVHLFYAITKTQYTATVSASDYIYGQEIAAPTLTNISVSGAYLEEVQSAQKTYEYHLAGSGESWSTYTAGMTLDAGVYEWRVSVAETTNFSYMTFNGTFTVDPKVLSIDWTESTLTGTYGTYAPAAATFEGYVLGQGINDLDLTYQYSGTANDGTQYTNSTTVPTKAGSYTVTVTIGNNNYVLSGDWADPVRTSSAVDYVINKLDITLKVDAVDPITFGENAPTYSYSLVGSLPYGEDIASVLAAAGITVAYEDGYAAGDAATTYTVRITNAFDLANYSVTTQNGTLTVEPFKLTVTITNPDGSLVYDGSAKTATFGTNIPSGFAEGWKPTLTLSYEVQGTDGGWTACGTPTNVGTYRAVVTMATNGNYDYTTTYGDAFTITNATITVEELSTDGIWYTGDAYALANYLAIETVNGQAYAVTFTVNDNAETALTAAGNYTVHYTITAPNHATVTDSFALNIQKNAVEWSDPSTAGWGWTYGDAGAKAPVDASNVSTLFAAHFANDTAADGAIPTPTFAFFTDEGCTSAYGSTFDNYTAAGTYYVRVSVADTANYDGYEAVYSFTVERAQLTITADSIANHVYNTAAPDYTATITGFVNGETASSLGIDEGVEYTLSCDYAAGSAVGQYTIAASGDPIIGNYTVTYKNGTLEVVAQGLNYITGELTEEQRTYSGNPIAYPITATGADDGQSVALTVYYQKGSEDPTTNAPTDAGTYTVTAVAADGYTASGWSTTFTILPREIAVNWSQASDAIFYYNGTDQSGGISASYNLWKNGSESRETAALNVALPSGVTFKDAAAYTFTASFDGGSAHTTYGYLSADGNYRMAETNIGRTQGYTISPRSITVTVTPQTVEYGDGFAIPESAVSVATSVEDGYDPIVGDDTAYTLQVEDVSGNALPEGSVPDADTYYIDLASTNGNYAVTLRSEAGVQGRVSYTIEQRELTLSFTGGANVTYGDNVDEGALRTLVAFSRTSGEGSAFLDKDSAVETVVLAALNFNLGGYTAQSNVKDGPFTVTISAIGTVTVAGAGNYAFVYDSASAQLTVERREITVTIDSKLNLTYGTDAVEEAAESLTATVTGGNIVNNDQNVYSLGVYNADGQITSGWDRLAVGSYSIVGMKNDDNYNITFVGDRSYGGGTDNAGTFEVVANEITVEVNETTHVYYIGSEYALLDGGALTTFARETLGFTAGNATNAQMSYAFAIQKDSSTSTLLTAGTYTVSYTVKADNYGDATGSFTVVIDKNAVTWADPDTSGWGWTYGDEDAAAPVTNENVSSLFAARFENGTAAAGAIAAPTFAFFTDEECTQSYTGGFNSTTDAGIYYVQVSVADTADYTGYSVVYSFTVAQKEVTVNWSDSTITQDAAMGAENYLEGYDPAIMQVISGDFGSSDLASDGNGWYVTVQSSDLRTYSVTIALTDPDNYDWPGDSENANRTILFSVSATAIKVTVNITGWTYGAASVTGPSVTVEPTVSFDPSDVVYAYALGNENLSEVERSSLGYAAVADLTMLPAGSYWVRALVPAAEDNSYGMAFGYAHFTVSPYAIAKPTASGETFNYNGNTQTYMSGFNGTVTLPNGQSVTAMVLSGNTGIDAGDYVATVRLASGNFVWTDNGDDPIRFDWTIAPQQLAMPTIGTLGTIDYMSTYTPGADQSLQAQRAELFGFNAELMSFSVTTGASYTDGHVAANNVGTYTVTISFKQIAGGNYCWTGGSADAVTLTWTIDPATYELGDFGFGDDVHEFVYNGQPQYPTLGNPPTGIRVTGYAGSATNVSDGEQAVTAALALVGPYATNFRFENGSTTTKIEGSVQITPAQIESVVWSSQNNFTYTGQDLSGNVHAYFIKADGSFGYLTVAVNNNDGFVNAGGYTFSVEGIENDDGNYELAASCTGMTSGTYTIEKVAVTVVVEDPADVVYDGAMPDLDTLAVNEDGYYGFTLIGPDGNVIKMDQLPQAVDRSEWLAYAVEVEGSAPWNVGDYIVTVDGGTLTNYTIAYIETSTVTVTPAPITGIEITIPNANMVYGELTAADAAYIADDSMVTVLLGGTEERQIQFSEVKDYIDLWYSGYTGGVFSTNVNAGTVWVFPMMDASAGPCNYTIADSSDFAVQFTVHKKTIAGEDFSAAELYYTGAAQALPRDNVSYDGDVTAFAGIFEDEARVVLSSDSYTAVGEYSATLTMAEDVYRNYCFENGASVLTLAWEIVPIGAGQVSVSMPELGITSWGLDTEANVLVTVESSATEIASGTQLNVADFRYEYQMLNASGEWVEVSVGSSFVWTAGSYRVRGIIADANFPAVVSAWREFTVEQGTYNTDVLDWSDAKVLYDGTEHNLTLRVGGVPDADGLLTAAQLHAADGIGLTYVVGAGRTDIGQQQISVTITAASPNYVFADGAPTFTLTATLTIEGRRVSVVWEGGSFTYNGTDQSAGVAAYFYDVNNERVDLDVSPDRAFIDAGGYTFTASGAPAGYILSGEKEDFTIARAAAAVVWPADAFTYNGTDQFGSVTAYFVDVNGEQVALALGSFVFRSVNDGGYTFEVIGAADETFNLNNYALTGKTEVLHMQPLAVTVTAEDKTVAYGDAAELTWQASNEVFDRDEENGLVVVALTREPGDAMGEYTIFISVSGATSNYTLTTVDGTYTIMQQTLHLQIRLPADRVYDGRPVSATLVGIGGAVPSGVYLYYNGTANDGTSWSSASAPTKAGTYTVSAYTSNASLDIVCSPVRLVIERAAAVIDVSGVQTHYTYTGAQQTVDSGAVLNHSETQLVYSNNTFTTVAEGDGLRVRIDAAQTCNYEAGTAFVTITVERQSIGGGLSVVIEDWTYGEDANDYRLSGNVGDGAVTALYTGTTNAGEAYESSEAPTEAGEFTLRVTVAATANYAAGSASDTFTVLRAEPELTLTIEGWTYGCEPNDFALTPALFTDYIATVYYTDGTLYFVQPPTEVGSYTLIVEVAQSPNYEAGSAQAHFVITFAGPELSATIEGWTYGEAPNAPVVHAEEGSAVTLRYTGTANDGTAWDSSEAPAKAGSYTLTATATNENFITETVTCAFIIARAPVKAPSLGEEGVREASAVYDGEAIAVIVVGYDGARMQPSSEALFELKDGQMKLVANAEGAYTVTFTLTDADNYTWAAEEGEDFSQGVVLTWTVTEKVDSLLWLIILLIILAVILLALLIFLIVQNKRAARRLAGGADGADGSDGAGGADGANDAPLYAMAPMGLLVVPAAHIAAVACLAAVVVGLLVADILLFVRLRRLVKEAEAAEEAAEDGSDAAADGFGADEGNDLAQGGESGPAAGEEDFAADESGRNGRAQ